MGALNGKLTGSGSVANTLMRMTNANLIVLLLAMGIIATIGRPSRGEAFALADTAEIQLGARLFNDDRFCSPKGDLRNSCSSCHMTDQSPEGLRAFTDFLTKSWVPWRAGDPRRDGLRNAPTIFDLSEAPRLHYDGEFTSLEELARGTLTGRSMGWLPGEETEAAEYFYAIVLADSGQGKEPPYRRGFKSAYDADIMTIGAKEALELASKSLGAYMRTLRSGRNTPYDQFIRANGLPAGPDAREKPREYAASVLAVLSGLEKTDQLKSIAGFNGDAIEGFKTFIRTDGAGAGNCVACHVPPLFTDFAFHNIGISQADYD